MSPSTRCFHALGTLLQRGVLWSRVAGLAGVYASLLRADAAESELEIVRDLSRTYPSHVFFQDHRGPGQRSLFNVLKAYAVYDRQVLVSMVQHSDHRAVAPVWCFCAGV